MGDFLGVASWEGVFQGNSPEVNLPGGGYTGSNSLEDNPP